MYLAILNTLTGNAQIRVAALTQADLDSLLTPLSANDKLANAYEVLADGRTQIHPGIPQRVHHIGKLSDLRKHLPKHPGGRPRKKTHCKICNVLCESYTEAKMHCWLKRLKGEK